MSRYLCIIVMLSTSIACAACGASAQAATGDEIKTVSSWAATAGTACEAWLRQQVPDAYAEQTLQAAAQSLDEENAALTKLEPSQQRAALITHLQQLSPLLQTMVQALKQRDRAALADDLGMLRAEQQGLAALAQQVGTQP